MPGRISGQRCHSSRRPQSRDGHVYQRGISMRTRLLAGRAAPALALAWPAIPAASAANTATFRDCSFFGGLDPDFVELIGAKVTPEGTLRVSPNTTSLTL